MDKTTLEGSIKRESEEMIAAIRKKEAEELRRLDEQCLAEMESFRKQTEAETETQIQQELTKQENKTLLERQKLNLLSVEKFINHLVDEVMNDIREHPHYQPFLFSAIGNVLKDMPGHAHIKLAAKDIAREKDIHAAFKDAGLVISDDPSIRWGGCLILDEEGGRIFNNTLERIYFRKSLLIRRKVMKILAGHPRGKNHSPAVES